jgi:pimeloyl-ACP methyl ester carboxylesterase
MHFRKFIFYCSVSAASFFEFAHLQGQTSGSIKPIFVIVHGAWGGSWAFKKVDSLMTEKNCIVYRPSLTGMGERSHLSNPAIDLQTHINDVVNMMLFEDLHDVILVGHSYGGMVVSGVADSLPGRIKKLIYLDAFVPENGESVFNILGSRSDGFKKMMKGDFIIPAWVKPGTPLPHDVPQPLKTFTDSIVLKNRAKNILTLYILTVEKGKLSKDDDFASQAERAKKKGWPILQLEADHNAQWSAPEQLAEMLYKNR